MTADGPALPASFLRECHHPRPWRHAGRALAFLCLYGVGAAAAVTGAAVVSASWGWLFLLPAWVLAGASLHGLSLFTHEAVHGTLAKNKALNWLLGAVCAMPVLQNCAAYRVLHLRHHRHLGEEGDPDHYANYTQWTWLVFTMHWLRLLVGYPVYVTAIPVLGFRHGTGRDRALILVEMAATGVLAWLAMTFVPAAWLIHAWLVPMLFINTMVNIRGMSQHTLLEHATDEIRGTRSILTSRLVRFFMCNENYHLEHHLHPGVPWHELPKLHASLKPELVRRGAPFIDSYAAFVGEFVRDSLRRSPLGRLRRS